MVNLSEKTILCYDYGNYIEVAIRLARDFGRVYYFNPGVFNGYPEHNQHDIGRNVPNIIKVKEWAEIIYEVDIVVFPDSHEPFLQQFFREQGKLVFGSAHACRLEHDRSYLKKTLKDLGLPVGAYYTAKGLEQLDEILKGAKDVYVKSSLRGDGETFHHTNYALSKIELKRMKHDLGVYANKETYIVEEKIDALAEFGYDGFTTNGMFPLANMAGFEIKDQAYCCKFIRYDELPEQIRSVNEKLSPLFDEMGYRGAYSNEIMLSKDKRGFLLDNTCRCGAPPTDLALELITNYSAVVWDIASGLIPDIKYSKPWGVQFIIKSEMAEKEPSPIIIPEEFRNKVKIKNLVIDDDGTFYYTPNGVRMTEIGSIIGMGFSLEEAVADAKKVSESIEGFDISINTDCIKKAKEQIERLSRNGIKFI
jgi:phosphoribosylamine-glycine ligase